MAETLNKKDAWINESPEVKEFMQMAKKYYSGQFHFEKNGKMYSAKLEPCKIKIKDIGYCKEAYFDMNKCNKKKCACKEVFYLRIVDDNMDTNVIKLT